MDSLPKLRHPGRKTLGKVQVYKQGPLWYWQCTRTDRLVCGFGMPALTWQAAYHGATEHLHRWCTDIKEK